MAILVAVFVIRALRAFELERQQRLVAANEARLAAQREALAVQQQAQVETEALNKELQTAVQNLTTLFELSYNLAMTLDQDTILRQTLPQICESIPRIECGAIFLCKAGQRPLQPVICHPSDLPCNGSGKETLPQPMLRVAEYVSQSTRPACWLDGCSPGPGNVSGWR